MNKLLYVNIGGVVFQIDEAAYKTLDGYLDSIRRKYSAQPEGEEILRDVENRIAELFTEKVGERGIISGKDVDEVTGIMGKPEDFEAEHGADQKRSAPSHGTERNRPTRFYRDKENNILGGVCAGFAAKFGIDVLWIRLAFVAVFFAFGTGFLLYIVLWIIMPEAKTTAEKLEMRGEPVDVSNIERSVREGAKQFGDQMKDFGQEVKETFSKERIDKTKKNAGDFIEQSVRTVKPFFNWVGRVIVFFVLILCLIILVVFSVEIISNWGRPFSAVDFLGNHIVEGSTNAWILVTCAAALVLIPIFGLLFSGIRYLMGARRRSRFLANTLLLLWIISLVAVIFLAVDTGRNYKYEASDNMHVSIAQPAGGTLYLQLDGNPPPPFITYHHVHHFDFMTLEDDSILYRQIHIHFDKSDDTSFVVLLNKKARGTDRDAAKQFATQIQFPVLQSGDSVLRIPSMLEFTEDQQWHAEQVDITLRIPENKSVELSKSLEPFLEDNAWAKNIRRDALFGQKLSMTAEGLEPAK